MGAAAARTVTVAKAVKPHVPLIKFPVRQPAPSLKARVIPEKEKTDSPDTVSSTPVANKDSVRVSKGPTESSPVLDASELPQKYRRKLISKEEMEIIEKGGAV